MTDKRLGDSSIVGQPDLTFETRFGGIVAAAAAAVGGVAAAIMFESPQYSSCG